MKCATHMITTVLHSSTAVVFMLYSLSVSSVYLSVAEYKLVEGDDKKGEVLVVKELSNVPGKSVLC